MAKKLNKIAGISIMKSGAMEIDMGRLDIRALKKFNTESGQQFLIESNKPVKPPVFVKPNYKPGKLIKPKYPSTSPRCGKMIIDINEIFLLADQGQCVLYRGGRTAAAFLQCMQARYLDREIRQGIIFRYIPIDKKLKK